MNIRSARDDASFLFPANISYGAPAEAAAREAAEASQAEFGRKLSGFGRRILSGLAWIVELPRRRAVMAQLEVMTDRELADIGLARGELASVFSGAQKAARCNAAPVRFGA